MARSTANRVRRTRKYTEMDGLSYVLRRMQLVANRIFSDRLLKGACLRRADLISYLS